MPADVLEPAAMVEDALREVSKIESILADAVQDSVRSARQAIKHDRCAVDDAIEEAQHAVKQRPFQAIGLAFAAGVLAGGFLVWIGFRRR